MHAKEETLQTFTIFVYHCIHHILITMTCSLYVFVCLVSVICYCVNLSYGFQLIVFSLNCFRFIFLPLLLFIFFWFVFCFMILLEHQKKSIENNERMNKVEYVLLCGLNWALKSLMCVCKIVGLIDR